MGWRRAERRESLGTLVRRRRNSVGLTQRELADRAGVSVGAVRDLEQGRIASPHRGSLERLTRALGLNGQGQAELSEAVRWELGDPPGLRAGITGERRAPAEGLALRVLGPLGCWRRGRPVAMGPARQRTVLAFLAVHANAVVHRDSIIDALWGSHPPDTAVAIVQSHVSRLRQVLEPVRRPCARHGILSSSGTSYRLEVGPGQLDLLAFEQLIGLARHARSSGDAEGSCAWYRRALSLWLDDPLADMDLLRGHPVVIGLGRSRAAVIAEYAEIASGLGQHALLLPELHALAEREPLNEKAHAQLMIALAGSGQQAAALLVYADLRRRLDDQLGVRPGPELSAAHLRVLRQDVPAASSPAVLAG